MVDTDNTIITGPADNSGGAVLTNPDGGVKVESIVKRYANTDGPNQTLDPTADVIFIDTIGTLNNTTYTLPDGLSDGHIISIVTPQRNGEVSGNAIIQGGIKPNNLSTPAPFTLCSGMLIWDERHWDVLNTLFGWVLL